MLYMLKTLHSTQMAITLAICKIDKHEVAAAAEEEDIEAHFRNVVVDGEELGKRIQFGHINGYNGATKNKKKRSRRKPMVAGEHSGQQPGFQFKF